MADIQNTVPQSVTPPSGRAIAAREFWANFSRNRGAVSAGVIVLVLIFIAIFAPLIAPHSPIEQYRDFVKIPPHGSRAATGSSFSAPTKRAATSSRV